MIPFHLTIIVLTKKLLVLSRIDRGISCLLNLWLCHLTEGIATKSTTENTTKHTTTKTTKKHECAKKHSCCRHCILAATSEAVNEISKRTEHTAKTSTSLGLTLIRILSLLSHRH